MSHIPTRDEIVGHLAPGYHEEVLTEFEGRSLDDFRNRLREGGEVMWALEASGKLSGSVFAYYFPAFVEYAFSSDSEYDANFPGWLGIAIDLQIQNAAPTARFLAADIRKVLAYINENLEKYYSDDRNWAANTREFYDTVLGNLTNAEQGADDQAAAAAE